MILCIIVLLGQNPPNKRYETDIDIIIASQQNVAERKKLLEWRIVREINLVNGANLLLLDNL